MGLLDRMLRRKISYWSNKL